MVIRWPEVQQKCTADLSQLRQQLNSSDEFSLGLTEQLEEPALMPATATAPLQVSADNLCSAIAVAVLCAALHNCLMC